MRHLRALGLLALPALLTACSQVTALAPVGGAPITTVRNAIYDVLVEQQVQLLVAPACEPVPDGFTCAGTTSDGRTIRATAGPTAPYELVITVDGAEIYRGTAQSVVDAELGESS